MCYVQNCKRGKWRILDKKISRNRDRNEEVNKLLLFQGWTVIRFWGRDIMKNTDECVRVIKETIFDLIIEDIIEN